jgi:hypothetical protein
MVMQAYNPLRDVSQDTLADLQRLVKQVPGEIRRDITTSTGLINYDLQRPAKQAIAWYFPLSRLIPHVQGNGDVMTHFKVITGVNTGGIEGGVPEGARGLRQATSLANKSVSYATMYLEDDVTFEAKGAGQGFEDVMARAKTNLMLAHLRQMELAYLGGDFDLALGQPTAQTPVDVGTGGTVPYNTAIHAGVVALTLNGFRRASVANGVPIPSATTGRDGTSITEGYGSSQISSDVTVTTANDSNNTHSVRLTCTPVPGAVAYAWFTGTTTTKHITAITTTNSYLLTAAPPSTGQASTASGLGTDNSVSPLVFDGFIPQAFAGGTVITMPTGTPGVGSPLNADGAGGIVEINNLFKTLWDTTLVTPRYLIMSSQEIQNVYIKSIANGGSPIFRFNVDANDTNPLTLGKVVGSYLNKFTIDGGALVQVILHPYMPPGTILALADTVPGQIFPGSNLGQLFEFHLPSPEAETHAIDWPLVTRAYEFGMETRGALAHYYPQTLGLITNIANG